jgi:hypothetical protein
VLGVVLRSDAFHSFPRTSAEIVRLYGTSWACGKTGGHCAEGTDDPRILRVEFLNIKMRGNIKPKLGRVSQDIPRFIHSLIHSPVQSAMQ